MFISLLTFLQNVVILAYLLYSFRSVTSPIPLPIFFTKAFFKYHSLASPLVAFAKTLATTRPLSTALLSTNKASPRLLSSHTSSYSWLPTTVGATRISSTPGGARPRLDLMAVSASQSEVCKIEAFEVSSAERDSRAWISEFIFVRDCSMLLLWARRPGREELVCERECWRWA